MTQTLFDLIGLGEEANLPEPPKPYLVYRHEIDPAARCSHVWTRVSSESSLAEAKKVADAEATHASVFCGGPLVHTNRKRALPRPLLSP